MSSGNALAVGGNGQLAATTRAVYPPDPNVAHAIVANDEQHQERSLRSVFEHNLHAAAQAPPPPMPSGQPPPPPVPEHRRRIGHGQSAGETAEWPLPVEQPHGQRAFQQSQQRQPHPSPAFLLPPNLLPPLTSPSRPAKGTVPRLPAGFLASFVARCFVTDLSDVDFSQGLTALEYLRRLEERRLGDLAAARAKLNVGTSRDQEVMMWNEEMEGASRRAASLYRQVYLHLRKWMLVNEMHLQPFNCSTCIALLNTLFPSVPNPSPAGAPFSEKFLVGQHLEIFSQIREVEARGPGVLEGFIRKNAAPGDWSGWPRVHGRVERYLKLAVELVEASTLVITTGSISDVAYVAREAREQQEQEEKQRAADMIMAEKAAEKRKADSGISFGESLARERERERERSREGDRPPSNHTSSSGASLFVNKPLPPPPPSPTRLAHSPSPSMQMADSTFTRLGQGLRRMKSRSEIVGKGPTMMRKMKSSMFTHERESSDPGRINDSFFDASEFKQKRLVWESKNSSRADQNKRM